MGGGGSKMVISVLICVSFSLCHPGPCPQCPAFVTKFCVCGRTRYSPVFHHVFSTCSELTFEHGTICGDHHTDRIVSLQSTHALWAGNSAAVRQGLRCLADLCRAHLYSGVPQWGLSALPAAGSAGWVSFEQLTSAQRPDWYKRVVSSRKPGLTMNCLCVLCFFSSVCYCGVTTRQVLCGTDKEGFDGSGHFSCEKICGM